MQRTFKTSLLFGLLVASMLALVPNLSADILLPTLGECEEVEEKLGSPSWGNLTNAQKDAYAETGHACAELYPVTYGANPVEDPDEGWTCVGFASVSQVSCALAFAQATRRDGACTGTPDLGEVCYEMRESGRGWTSVAATSGHVITEGHDTNECFWPNEASSSQCDTDLFTAKHYDVPHTECFTLTTTTWVFTYAGGLSLPSGKAIDTDTETCP